ncbi:hypothetical protein AX17_006127 [Amanita inopinata Kibby_2008]|nr:hypothetical protein AX17_006127 [Amanita inopinata Kibby_2008]
MILNVDPVKFEKFLWVFYNPTYSLYDASVEDWCDILELAHEWGFVQAKRLAIRELQKLSMPVIDRVALYQRYNVDQECLIPLYAELCTRGDILTLEESNHIGMPTAIMILTARELWRARNPPLSPSSEQIERDELYTLIETTFRFPQGTASAAHPPGNGNNAGSYPGQSNGARPILNTNGRTSAAGGRNRYRA